ncbi:MAG: ribonucleoside-diphosphate reductase, adenosylcobalamin-dependent, partial [Pseudomonadota bacterium]
APWQLVWKGQVVRQLSARALWNQIMQRNYDAAEPGVLFIDRINHMNPLRYAEDIAATNSCAEQPLPPFGACPLSAINMARLVSNPFQSDAALDLAELRRLVRIGVRMLDNVIDISQLPLPEQRHEAQEKRRIGLGVMGIADALAMAGETYGSDWAAAVLSGWMREIQNTAYRASIELAQERGAFPCFDADRHLESPTVARLDPDVREGIAKHGLRNGLLTTLAPTGTTALLAGNVSSGIEPIFSTSFIRRITREDGTKEEQEVVDYAVALHRRRHGRDAPLPESVVTAMTLSPMDHVKMQAAAQTWIDSAISKTVNCPEDISFDDFQDIYLAAYERGCKGCTTYRPNAVTGAVLAA